MSAQSTQSLSSSRRSWDPAWSHRYRAPAHSGPTPTGFGLRTTFPRNPSGGAHYDPDGGLQCDLGGSGTAGELVAVREEVGAR